MFNVGDIVEITEQSSATGMLDFVKGKGYEVMATNATHWRSQLVQLKDESGAEDWFHYNHFKLKEDTIVEKKECLFKEGQVVWDVVYGKGVIVEIAEYSAYPVIARFSDETMAYGVDGRTYETHGRTLFFSEPRIEAATEPVFVPSLQVGTPIILTKCHVSSQMIPAWVTKETEDSVTVETTDSVNRVFYKKEWNIYSVGEKIEFE